jgi:hypothetical protein
LTSQASFWDDADLPDAVEEASLPSDATVIINPPENVCRFCGEEVVREPGARGRTPKTHKECREAAKGAASTRASGPRPVRVSAKERLVAEQIEEAIDHARGQLMKATALLALADPYDALVLLVNTEDLLKYYRVLLYRFPRLRDTASDVEAVTSIFELVITILSIALPIAAHHKLIPSQKLSQIFLAVPMFMLRMQERMAEQNPGAMAEELLVRVAEESRKATEARMRAQSAQTESVHATDSR